MKFSKSKDPLTPSYDSKKNHYDSSYLTRG